MRTMGPQPAAPPAGSACCFDKAAHAVLSKDCAVLCRGLGGLEEQVGGAGAVDAAGGVLF